MKKRILPVFAILLISVMPLSLFACNQSKKLLLTDIYYDRASYPEFSGYKREITLDQGWYVKVDDKNKENTGYIKSLDAFVIAKQYKVGNNSEEHLSLYKCGADGMIFPEEVGIKQMAFKGDLIAFLNGRGGVFRASDGALGISRKYFKDIPNTVKIENVIKILDNGLVAVSPEYEANGEKGYTSIFRPTYTGSEEDRGVLVCRIKNEGNLTNLNGFDSNYVSVTDLKVGSKYYNRIYRIPAADEAVQEKDKKLVSPANGTYIQNSKTDYYCELTYIGGGRFLVHEDWTVGEEEDYTYFYDDEYVMVSRHIYNAANDTKAEYNSDLIFLNLSNRYYGAEKNSVDVGSFLKGDYMYSTYGISVENKIGYYDQFILDGNLNVVLSLTGNLGLKFKNQTQEKVSFFDLIMSFTDGCGFVPLYASTMRLYSKNGNILFENNEYSVVSAGLNSGMIVANIPDKDNAGEYLYGAFDIIGNVAVPFIYSNLEPFRGYYTMGVRAEDGERVIVGKDGKEVTEMSDGSKPLSDFATTGTGGTGKAIYKMGCYMYADTRTENGKKVDYFGIKNFNANSSKNIVMPANMIPGSILYAPSNSPQDAFVFEKILGTATENISYVIYRLI